MHIKLCAAKVISTLEKRPLCQSARIENFSVVSFLWCCITVLNTPLRGIVCIKLFTSKQKISAYANYTSTNFPKIIFGKINIHLDFKFVICLFNSQCRYSIIVINERLVGLCSSKLELNVDSNENKDNEISLHYRLTKHRGSKSH